MGPVTDSPGCTSQAASISSMHLDMLQLCGSSSLDCTTEHFCKSTPQPAVALACMSRDT
jgi:hypothetical protein